MKCVGLKSRLIEGKYDLFTEILEILKNNEVILRNKDILAISSKICSICEGNVQDLRQIKDKPKLQRQNLALTATERPELAYLIEREADRIMPGEYYLTVKNNIFVANSGIDESNMPEDLVVMWPVKPYKSANSLQKKLISHFKLNHLGIIIVDSVCIPLRQGAIGNAIGYSGFRGIVDKIGLNDLYGKALKVTKVNIADSLATAANLIMGEADESTPVVLISDYGAEFTNEMISETEIVMDGDKCIFKGLYPNNK